MITFRDAGKPFLSSSRGFLKRLKSLAAALRSLSSSCAAGPESPPFGSTAFASSGTGWRPDDSEGEDTSSSENQEKGTPRSSLRLKCLSITLEARNLSKSPSHLSKTVSINLAWFQVPEKWDVVGLKGKNIQFLPMGFYVLL